MIVGGYQSLSQFCDSSEKIVNHLRTLRSLYLCVFNFWSTAYTIGLLVVVLLHIVGYEIMEHCIYYLSSTLHLHTIVLGET